MRPIKFRAWDKEEKIMIYFDNFDTRNTGGFWGGTREVYEISMRKGFGECEGIGYFHDDFAEYVNLELMQFTGLLDKNGKEIYEECEIDDVYTVKYNAPCYILENIYNGDIINLSTYDGQFKITREYKEIPKN